VTQRAGDYTRIRFGRVPEDASSDFFIPELCTVPAISVLVLAGELLVFVLLLSGGALSWERLGIMSLFVQWVVLASAGVLCVLRGWLERFELAAGAFISYGVVVVVTLVLSIGASVVMPSRSGAVDWLMVFRNVLISAILAGMMLRYLYVQHRLRSQEQSELQSRIQALQSRIRPHFLFNSMNIIASLIATEPDTAETVVEDLSELFRASLNDVGNQVSLEEELGLCERYVRIEGLRLGERLQVEWDIDAIPREVRIPLLTLQPLLENAIYHGIQPLPEGGTIKIGVFCKDDEIHVEITNPLPRPELRDDTHTQGNRMAVANIRSRLEVLYGDRATFSADVLDDVYVTRLSFPGGVA
jgi:two-component system sensor histidine kinase AlgZ